MNCPNCGKSVCKCSWVEQARAIKILRKYRFTKKDTIPGETVCQQDDSERRHGLVAEAKSAGANTDDAKGHVKP